MKYIPLFCMTAIFTAGSILVFAGRDTVSRGNLPQLEEQIPYDIRVTVEPTRFCDPLEIEVVITRAVNGDNFYQWRIMEGDNVQMEFPSFDDLYYRCDSPGCFMIRTVEVDGATGNRKPATRNHVCLK
jgi:hypothetical protein